MADEDFPDALPARYRLHWYVLERVLGQGGFGITYLAHDTNLDRHVAIKEYLPTEVARRRSDASARPRTETHSERYAWGLERFLSEARTLARFDHPNIVRVLSVFEANNTAYMVMRFEEGEDLATLLDRRGTLPEPQLMECLMPVLDGLQLIHATGFIHRDIKPENIYVRHDHTPVLLDFGSARQSFGSAKTMTILVAPGYAPLEQYYGDAKTQGAWTDIYGLGATCYRAIAGRAPLDAVARAKGVLGSTRDILQSAAEAGAGRYGERLLAAIDHALQLSERNRPQSVSAWRAEIVAPEVPPAVEVGAAPPVPESTIAAPATAPAVVADTLAANGADGAAARPKMSRSAWGALAGAAVVLVAVAYLASAPRNAPAIAATPTPGAAAAASPSVAPSPVTVPAAVPTPVVPALALPAPATLAPTVAPAPAPIPVTSRPAVAPPSLTITSLKSTSPDMKSPTRSLPSSLPSALPETAARTLAPPGTAASTTVVAEVGASPPAPPLSSLASPVAMAAPASAPARRVREELETADAALRRGDVAAAAQILAPLAAAGVPGAQLLLARAREARSTEQHSDFEAFVWYSIAARNGEPTAGAARDKLAARLQPAEIRQAEQIAERWKPRVETRPGPTSERSPP